jgi:tripartite-type tricarboxylate transporter receptor subunit TctC
MTAGATKSPLKGGIVKTVAWLCFLVVASNLAQSIAAAESYPSKPIRFVVAWPAGGPADQRARQIAEKLTKAMGQPVLVENRSGASGAIGASAAAKAPPDGYTLLWGTLYELAIHPAVNPALSYEPLRDLVPITQVAAAYLVLDARPGLGPKSLNELIALARAKPGQLTCGSAGNATASHFALEVLKRSAKIDITHVPFKGDAPLLTDLLGGHVDIGFNVTSSALPHTKAGKLIPLAVSSAKRLSPFPEVPTMTELGFPEMEITLWSGVLAPARTPPEIIKRLNTELVKIIGSAELREQWVNGGAQATPSTPEDFAALIQSEQARWARLIKQTGVKME